MNNRIAPLVQRPSWVALQAHQKKIAPLHLRKLFADDAGRGQCFSLEAAGVYLDYSKNRITEDTMSLLVQLAEHIDAMFRGGHINVSENRAALHVALRTPKGESIFVGGRNVMPQVHAVLEVATALCKALLGPAVPNSSIVALAINATRALSRHDRVPPRGYGARLHGRHRVETSPVRASDSASLEITVLRRSNVCRTLCRRRFCHGIRRSRHTRSPGAA
jgi:hypothetical protein